VVTEHQIGTDLGVLAFRGDSLCPGKTPTLLIPDYGTLIGPGNLLWKCPLTAEYSLVAVDPFGTGNSDRSDNPTLTVQGHSQAIYHALLSFAPTPKWSVVGLGTGFPVAVELGRQHPEMISHVVGLSVGRLDPRPTSGSTPLSSSVGEFVRSELPLWLHREKLLDQQDSLRAGNFSEAGFFYFLKSVHEYIRQGEFFHAIESFQGAISWIVPEEQNVRPVFFNSATPTRLSIVEIPSPTRHLLIGNYRHTMLALQVALGVGRDL
jgi:pimeloyl-ACP methyl ester carboxylesterase